MKINLIKASVFAVLAPLLLATHAMGATIIWDVAASPQLTTATRDDQTQVFTTGSLVAAASVWATFTTAPVVLVNGVTFQNWNSATNFTAPSLGTGGGTTNAQSTWDGSQANKLVSAGEYITATDDPTHPWTFSGLNINDSYKVEVWVPSWSSGSYNTQFAGTSNGTNTGNTNQSPTLSTGNNSTTFGQYIFGTFTADATTQTLYQFAAPGGSGGYSLASAFELRDLGAVPEPTTISLLSLGGLALVLRRRSRQRKLIA